MSKEPKQSMYKRFSFKDTIVILLSLIALTALVFMVRYSDDRSKMEQEKLAETSNFSLVEQNSSLSASFGALIFNEINQSGWIELHNNERNMGIELSKCYITVNGDKKFTFQATDVIEAGELLVIEGMGQLGTTNHDIIGIYNEKGEILKNIMIPSLAKDESYGCWTDGEINYGFLTASKAKTNGESSLISKGNLDFSVPGGFYEDSFQLEITAAKGKTIYYTLDGTRPTAESNLYEGPILIQNKSGSNIQYATSEGIDYLYSYKPSSISMGMVVRAIAVDSSGANMENKTQSYFVGLKNASDIKNLPVLSITTSPENLFDYFDGIYVSGRSHEDAIARGEDGGASANYLNGWEKEVYVEYFEPQKDKTFEGNMSISIMKDISVTLPQKSLLLTGKGGAFVGSSLNDFYNEVSNKLVVQTYKRDNTYKIREFLAGKLLSLSTIGAPDITPCIVFLNGEYWGGYMLKAEYDEEYIERHYGVDKGDVLIAKGGKVTTDWKYQPELEELYSYIANHDLKEDENYAWVKAHMDVTNYLEYFCVNMYLANAEYGQDQLVMWRTITEGGKDYEDGRWRFLIPKLDNTMNNGATGKVATGSINSFLQAGVKEDIILQSLLRNEEFKHQLIMVMSEMVEKVFTSERVNSSLAEISMQMKKMVEMSCKRFSGNVGSTFYMDEVDKIISFFEQRKNYILLYTEEVIN